MKKIIFSICIIILYIIFGNITYVEAASSFAATVENKGIVSYITAGYYGADEYDNWRLGQKKKIFYNTEGLTESLSEVAGLFEEWYDKNTIIYPYDLPSFYNKAVYREKIGGSDAFCLNPGRTISKNGYNPITSEFKKFSELGKDEDFDEKIYAIIYYSDFSNLKVLYRDTITNSSGYSSFTIGDEGDYIIKQLLFWAYRGSKGLLFSIDDESHGEIENGFKINEDILNEYTATGGIDLFKEDIFTALLHNKQLRTSNTTINKLKDDFYLNDSWLSYHGETIASTNNTTYNNIFNILKNTGKNLTNDNPDVKITKYKPEDPNTQQYFVGIYIPDAEVKNYAVIDNYGGNLVVRTGYTTLGNDGVNVECDTDSAGYECTGYDVYISGMHYNSPQNLVKEVTKSDDGPGNSYILDYKSAGEYNVIVFNYDVKKYNLTVYYQCKAANSDTYTTLSSSTEQQKQGAKVSKTKIYNTIYNNTLYNGSSASSLANFSDSGNNVTFTMPANDVTIYIYYQYGVLDYRHVLNTRVLSSGTEYNKDNVWGSSTKTINAYSNNELYCKLDGNSYIRLKYLNMKQKAYDQSTSFPTDDLRKNGESKTSTSISLSSLDKKKYTALEFYYQIVPSTKVIVRHLVKQSDGTYALNNNLSNANAVVQNNAQAYTGVSKGTSIVVGSGYSQRKSVYNATYNGGSGPVSLSASEIKNIINYSYSEFYEIDQSDKIIIDRSRKVISDGIYYKCIGFKTGKADSNTALGISGSGVNTTSSLQQVITGGKEYVFIDYYYDPEDYSKDVYDSTGNNNGIGNSARLRFMPKAAGTYTSLGNSVVTSNVSGANENESIAYVPVTENLKPYVVTDICRARTAEYGIAISNGKLVYNVANYTAWGVSDDDNMANVQGIIGTDTDTRQVYNRNIDMNINKSSIQSYIKDTISDVNNVNSVFSGNANSANTAFENILDSVASGKTTESYYYNSDGYNIASNKYNGLRQPTGNISYKIYTISSSGIVSKTGNTNSNITEQNSMKVNIYTPVAVGDVKISSIDFVNHSNVESNTSGIIQQGVEFSVTVSTKKDKSYGSTYGNINNTGKYVKNWYLMFDFDVIYQGRVYIANEDYIKVTANHGNIYAETTISGIQAVTTSTDKNVISSALNHVKVIASTINLPSDDYANTQISRTDSNKTDANVKHIDKEYIKLRNDSSSPKSQDDGLGMKNDSYYLVSDIEETISIGRVFDFEITDCLDVNFKDVFRNINSSDNTVNSLTGTRYFSGIRRLLALDSVTSTTTNSLVARSNLAVGSVTKILPLGPYKHTTNAYIQSVKLGYRFSFDVKTSGYYDPNIDDVTRSVRITPSYYYISKDGKTFNDNIKLYYKNSSGNYANFESSNYTIYYKPNDGYRNTYNSGSYNEGVAVDKTTSVDRTTLTTSLVGLNISKAFTLSSDKSMTTSDNKYLQAWYGEFKVPNSTIALAVDAKGNIDINSPLTDGYIGVKFEIECIDKYKGRTEDVIVSYSNNDKGLGNNATNTSQWDYEGYLGFKESNIGSKLNSNVKIQLENGVWDIDDDTYQKIKGTVMLYDLDNRAANDYD